MSLWVDPGAMIDGMYTLTTDDLHSPKCAAVLSFEISLFWISFSQSEDACTYTGS